MGRSSNPCVKGHGGRSVRRNAVPDHVDVYECRVAQRDHGKSLRQYAHTMCRKGPSVCVAKEYWDLPPDHKAGIMAHEIGHLLAGPQGGEQDADDAFERASGFKILYKDGRWGERLQYVGPEAGDFIDRHFPVFEVKSPT